MQRSDQVARRGPLTHDPEAIAGFRRALEDAGYTETAVKDALATEVSTSRDSTELPLYLRMLPEGEPLSALIKLFLLGVTVPVRDAAAALQPVPLARVEALGVVGIDGDVVRPLCELVPKGDLLIACDRFDEELTRPDHVLGISPPTNALAALTVRPDVEDTLDLCTGNGIQALMAAQHSRRIVAVDVNERALRFAEFNALLNSVPTIEFREGNLFDPVEGETFDLVVCNPPYVVSPDAEFIYRDSGVRGDVFCETIVRELPRYMRDGAFAHVLVSWVHRAEQEWSEPLVGWVEGNGCDAVILRYATHDPLQYAAGWNRPLRTDSSAYADALDRWRGHFDQLGIEAISWGAIILRKRSGSNWLWPYSPSAQRVRSAGQHVFRLFEAHDLLDGLGDDAFLDCRFELARDHRLEQASRVEDEGRVIEGTVLRLAEGLRFAVSVDPATEDVLHLLDGHRTMRDVLAHAHERLPRGVSAGEFDARALPALRRLVELGFLVPRAGVSAHG
jgi:Methyltransferase small domain